MYMPYVLCLAYAPFIRSIVINMTFSTFNEGLNNLKSTG